MGDLSIAAARRGCTPSPATRALSLRTCMVAGEYRRRRGPLRLAWHLFFHRVLKRVRPRMDDTRQCAPRRGARSGPRLGMLRHLPAPSRPRRPVLAPRMGRPAPRTRTERRGLPLHRRSAIWLASIERRVDRGRAAREAGAPIRENRGKTCRAGLWALVAPSRTTSSSGCTGGRTSLLAPTSLLRLDRDPPLMLLFLFRLTGHPVDGEPGAEEPRRRLPPVPGGGERVRSPPSEVRRPEFRNRPSQRFEVGGWKLEVYFKPQTSNFKPGRSPMSIGIALAERGLRSRLASRGLRHPQACSSKGWLEERSATCSLGTSSSGRSVDGPVAPVPEKANEQHYEVPADFFERRRSASHLKYSSALLAGQRQSSRSTRRSATMLALTCERAQISRTARRSWSWAAAGARSRCGWREHFPNARRSRRCRTAPSQREFILEALAGQRAK